MTASSSSTSLKGLKIFSDLDVPPCLPKYTSLSTDTDPVSLKCSICLELFSDPRILPCLHTCCLKCLQGLVSDQKNDLSCPQCRAKHEIPKGDVTNFLCDLSILPELESAKADIIKKEETKICGLCISGEVAVGYCRDCNEYLCECCHGPVHKKIKLFSTHEITSIEELESSPVVTHGIKQPARCPCHSEYKLEVFCKTCDRVVCSMCMLETTHKGHSYDFLKNVQDELMERIESLTGDIEDKEIAFKNDLAFVEKFEKQVCNQRDKLETDINAACDEYISKIQAMKEKLLKQVESKFTEDCKTIWAIKNHLEIMICQFKSCQAFSERYQKQGSEGQMLSLMNQLLHCLTELNFTDVDLSVIQSVATPRIKFIKSPLYFSSVGTLLTVKNIVFVTERKLQQYTVELRKKTNFVCLLNEPLFSTEKWECKCYRNSTIMLLFNPAVVISDNLLEVEFTPTVPGKYSFQLTSSLTKKPSVQFHVNVNHVDALKLIGARVKRGPDWCYGNHDGGDGKLGTVESRSNVPTGFDCSVKWDITKYQESIVSS